MLADAYFASYLRDEPIRTWDGEEIQCRPEHKRGRPVTAWVVGDHLKHIGMTIYRILMDPRPSDPLFSIIRDEKTGLWRAWEPSRFPNDWERMEAGECRNSPPIIPPQIVEEIAFAPGRKKEHEFRRVLLANGSTFYAFASSGEVKQGDAVDLIWVDENIVNKTYYQEWLKRLIQKGGHMVWSTMPRDDCYLFSSVNDRMEEVAKEVAAGERKPAEDYTTHATFSMLDSPFITDDDKRIAVEQSGERDTIVRIFGKSSTQLIAVYQTFNPTIHTAVYNDDRDDAVAEALKQNNYVPPADWTREVILDPGTQKPGVLCGAIPPPNLWDHGEPYYIVYREIYIRRLDAAAIAEQVMLTERDYMIERFIIDGHCGRQTPPGFSWPIEHQYTIEFEKARLQSRQTGFGFVEGDDSFERRSRMVMHALRIRPCGRPQLRIISQSCRKLVHQMKTNVRKTSPDGEPLEEPAPHQNDDLRECLEYWISRRPRWVKPMPARFERKSPGDLAYEQLVSEWKQKQANSPKSSSIMIGVP